MLSNEQHDVFKTSFSILYIENDISLSLFDLIRLSYLLIRSKDGTDWTLHSSAMLLKSQVTMKTILLLVFFNGTGKYLWLPSKHSQGSVVKERTWTKEGEIMLKNWTILNRLKPKMISQLDKVLFLDPTSITFQTEIHGSFETLNLPCPGK